MSTDSHMIEDDPMETVTFEPSDLLAQLKETAKGPQPTERPTRLPLSSIRQVPAVFQPRGVSERHVSELARVISTNGEVEPITVVQVGSEVVLIDGHHRVEAYATINRASMVPVRYFEGSLDEAVLEAGRANSRAKLPMSSQERQDYAWRLVLMDSYSKAQVATASGASKSQVAVMRTVRKKLGDDAYAQRSWWRAREMAQGKDMAVQISEDELEVWKEEKANRFADRMSKEFGTKLSNSPEIAARALSIYFGRRMGEVMGYLAVAGEGEFEDEFSEF